MTLRTSFFFMITLALASCQGASGYDEATSLAYRAAWALHRSGDEAGYKRALEALSKQRGTWAGDRAAIDLERLDETASGSFLRRLVEQAARVAGDTKPPGDPAPDPPTDTPPAP
jgi:hypothetical protein